MAYFFARPLAGAFLIAGFALGCRSAEKENIPTFPPLDAQQSLAAMRARSAGVESIAGQGNITLTDARGDAVRLDAAFVFAPPDRARVRAWKFGQAVLDLTVAPDGTWLFIPRGHDGRAEQLRKASGQTGDALKQWLRLLSGDVEGPGTTAEIAGAKLLIRQTSPKGLSLRCEIDRATLTPRRYTLSDPNGVERFGLTLGRYQAVGSTVWPRQIKARSDAGQVLIEARDPELGAAPAGAFTPPARAVKLP